MKIEIEITKNEENGYYMSVDGTRNFIFDDVDSLMARLGEIILEKEEDKGNISF